MSPFDYAAHRLLLAAAIVVPALGLAPASAGPTAPGRESAAGAPTAGVHRATIRRTSHGIPHIVADDFASLGFGNGYATAETSPCVLADTLLTARGERSRWFGADARYSDQVTLDATNLQTDALFTDLRNRRVVEELLADPVRGPGEEARAMVRGYAAGFNEYLEDVGGSDGIQDPACAGAEWVQPATGLDLWYGV
ncbi:MAG: penicillin acylase family protein [Nocardioidaceae bacterium]